MFVVRGFENYLLFYKPVKGGIEVLRVLHGARNIQDILESYSEERGWDID